MQPHDANDEPSPGAQPRTQPHWPQVPSGHLAILSEVLYSALRIYSARLDAAYVKWAGQRWWLVGESHPRALVALPHLPPRGVPSFLPNVQEA